MGVMNLRFFKWKELLLFSVLFIITYFLLSIPMYIKFHNTNLMEWQRNTWEWNYLGVFSNFIIVFIFIVFKKTNAKELGIQMGKWKNKIVWYITLTFIVLFSTKLIDFFTKQNIGFYLPSFNIFLFQFLFVAIGEELFWRGFVQSKFGFWYSAIGFGLIHFLSSFANGDSLVNSISYGLFTIILGICFSWVRNKTESLYPSMLLHGLYNLSNYIIK